MMIIDSHVHVNSLVRDDCRDEIRDINSDRDIFGIINVGLNYESSLENLEISSENEKFYTSVGIHPLYIDGEDVSSLYELAKNDMVVAIGEIGLDSLKDNFLEQRRYLIEQIMIANELELPVIIHSNNMNKKVIEIFEKCVRPKWGCVFHCFQPDIDDMNYLVSMGYYISFGGRITYKNAKRSLEVLREVPEELFLVETDSPYIAPEPYRGCINSTKNIRYVIERVSMVKGISIEDVENLTIDNTKRLFRKIR